MVTIREGTRQLDLYDFFSVYIPGATFILILLPLIPAKAGKVLDNIGILTAVVLLGGFVAGRAVHAFAVLIEIQRPNSHRAEFFSALQGDREYVSEETIETLHRLCTTFFDQNTSSLEEWKNQPDDGMDPEINQLYTLIRTTVHIDGRGRSRTFQAINDFFRTMLFVFTLSMMLYFIYIIGISFGQSYGPLISTLGLSELTVSLIPVISFEALSILFIKIRPKYQRYYIQYLIADFIVLASSSSLQSARSRE